MHYRREIDGLRALAVLPVIFFHAGFSAFSGGFVGVDVFFVISGYLITGIILAELANGKFSIAGFYERRARRILPALFLVIAVSLPFAWLWLLPDDMRGFSESVLAVAGFASNILFWRRTDYFAPSSELSPLLHTWSLAVEEQFYLFFPLLLIVTWRFFRHGALAIILLLSAISLAIAQWGVTHEPGAAFYLLPTRGWELALGAAIAMWCHERAAPQLSLTLHQALSLAGLGLVAGSVFLYGENTPSPGLAMLAPTLGAGLIIFFATPATWVGRLLSLKPVVAIGLVSYSAYLWHQPLFAFARHRSLYTPSASMYFALSVLSVGLGWLSWRWVERPFRDKSRLGRRQIFAFATAGTVALVLFGAAGHVTKGYFWRNDFQQQTVELEERVRVNLGLADACGEHHHDRAECRTTYSPEVLLWGDSYAMHLAQGMLASNPNIALVQATRSVCGPILGVAPVNAEYPRPWAEDCIQSNDRIVDYLRNTPSIQYAVLASPFHRYLTQGDQLLLADGRLVESGEAGMSALRETLSAIRELGVTPLVVAPPPKNGMDIGRCLVNASRFGVAPSACNFRTADINLPTRQVYAALSELEPETKVIWLHRAICGQETCNALIERTFIYRDNGHLSREGSALLGQRMGWYQIITAQSADSAPTPAMAARRGAVSRGP
ncbi:MAG: acyltransferase family protein [Pseudomonadota bacterium]